MKPLKFLLAGLLFPVTFSAAAQMAVVPNSERPPTSTGQHETDTAPNNQSVTGIPLEQLVKRDAKGSDPSMTFEAPGPAELIVEAVDPVLTQLNSDQMLALMQESMRNSQLAEQLQGEPRKMLIERNDYIAHQLLLATQATKAKEISSRWQLRVAPAGPQDQIVETKDQQIDWSDIGSLEAWIGVSFFDKQYPSKISQVERRHFLRVAIVDTQTNQIVPLTPDQTIEATRNGAPIPVLRPADGDQALLAWTEQPGQNLVAITLTDTKLPTLKLETQLSKRVLTTAELVDIAREQSKWSMTQKLYVAITVLLLFAVIIALVWYLGSLIKDGLRYRTLQKGAADAAPAT